MTDKPSYQELERRVRELENEARARRLVDEVLQKSEARYRMIFGYSPLGIIHFDVDGTVLDCNERFLEIVGASKQDFIGFNMVESLKDDRMKSAITACLSGEPACFEGDYLSVTGNRTTLIRAMYSRIDSEDGRFLGALGLFEEITARKRAAEAVRESWEFLSKLVNCISDPIFVKDRQHRLVLVNDAECALAGKTRDEILGRTDYDFFPHEQVDVFWTKDEEVFQTGEVNENEELITDAQGITRTIITKKSLYTDSAQNEFIVGVVRDITDRKESEKALQTAHRELQDIVEFLPDAILVIDRDGRVTHWNRAMEELTGVKKADILGKGDFAYSVPFYGNRQPILIDLVMAEKPAIENRYDLVKRVGDTIYGEGFVPRAYQGKGAHLWSTAAPLIGRDGGIIGFIQSIRDVSDRKRAREAVRQSEEKYRQLFETVSDAIFIFDAHTLGFVDVNERAVLLYGYTREEFLRLQYCDISAEPDLSIASIEETLAGARTEVPLRYHRKKDGTPFPVEISSSTFMLAGRRVLCGVVRDISERKRVEEELCKYRDHLEELIEARTAELEKANELLTLEIEERRRAEELLKIFAYSVAHDLKSPAIGIYGLTRRLHSLSWDILDEKGRLYCDQILRVSEHIVDLVDKINVYIATKEARLLLEQIVMREFFSQLREEFSEKLSARGIDWIAPDSDLPITADRVALLRVFRNIVDNALKHGGDQLSRIRIGHSEQGDYNVFTVRDDGKGLQGADARKIFGVFQRQEASRGIEGAGLGLAIVKDIAEKHGGKAWVELNETRGATFYIAIAKHPPPP